jgi:hypothetical protein
VPAPDSVNVPEPLIEPVSAIVPDEMLKVPPLAVT